MIPRPSRFWIGYALGWAPYLVIVILAYVTSGEARALRALTGALTSVAPPALLGIGVVHACRRLPWTPRAPGPFFVRQVALALTYALLAVGIQVALYVGMEKLRRGGAAEVSVQPMVVSWQLLMALLVYLAIAGVTYTTETHARLRAEEERTARARALQAEAELAALRAQLNPHFLFNTLHTVLALVREDPAAAERALEQFGDLLRYALRVQSETRDEGTLAEEWSFVRDYLALEQLRLGERLRLYVNLEPQALACMVPVFCLQPLVENAVRHGIEPRASGGTIGIEARAVNGRVELRVLDDGDGDAAPESSGAGVGLRLLRQRLDALYGRAAELAVEPAPAGGGFAVRVRLPARRPA